MLCNDLVTLYMNEQLTPETMKLKEQIKTMHEDHYVNAIPYEWTFTHHQELIPATVFISPGIKLEITDCIADDGYNLMDGFIDRLTRYEILKRFKEEHCQRPELTEQLIKSIQS